MFGMILASVVAFGSVAFANQHAGACKGAKDAHAVTADEASCKAAGGTWTATEAKTTTTTTTTTTTNAPAATGAKETAAPSAPAKK